MKNKSIIEKDLEKLFGGFSHVLINVKIWIVVLSFIGLFTLVSIIEGDMPLSTTEPNWHFGFGAFFVCLPIIYIIYLSITEGIE